jgi:hypothetical protein
MKIENLQLGDWYKDRDYKRVGVAVMIENGLVSLQGPRGDMFCVPLSSLEYTPVYEESDCWIDLNVNDPKDTANAFLCRLSPHSRAGTPYDCIGGAELKVCGEHKGKWQVDVGTIYDEETNSDCRIVGYFESQDLALKALWDERERALA